MFPRNTPPPTNQQATNTSKDAQSDTGYAAPQAPAITLPKGGGAIRGIGEKFAANPVTGTGSMTVPIATSPGRSGFGPQLSLSYDSGAGNGPFGFGWSLGLPSITRKTDKGLPRYRDADESDVFILSGAEDLVPVLDSSGSPVHQRHTVHGITYDVCPYRPRIEGLFARIERWVAADTGISHWRSITRDNVTTLYGFDDKSRIADPTDPRKIFVYRICRTFDDKGNIALYEYVAEDGAGVNRSQAHEANRTGAGRAAQCYLKSIRYGNVQPYFPDWSDNGVETLFPADWHFEVVLDYGDHSLDLPMPTHDRTWPVRPDAFSAYRAGFEVRTYRRCKRVLLFHHFANEVEVSKNCLVRSTDFVYSDEQTPADPSNPIYTFLQLVTQTGYRREGNGYRRKSMPPLEFEYSQPQIQPNVLTLDVDSFANLPEGLDGARYQWVDLDGEGLSGILTDFGGGWGYKRNLSPINQVPQPDGSLATRARFGPLETVAALPSRNALGSGQQFLDLSGDGQLDLVAFDGAVPGFFERTSDANWEPFQQFASLPRLNWSEPNMKFADLTGDGLADILITEDGLFTFYPSLGEAGFDAAEMVRTPWDEDRGPKVVLADGTQTVFLADMSGDNLSDIVRVRNGEVCYWPNLGYGRFGAKVTMDFAPRFADEERFDPRRIRLADIDGSGTTDLLYIGDDGVQVCCNRSGNAWAAPHRLAVFPTADSLSAVQVTDLLGNGTACLVWSSPLPSEAAAPLRYVDLMGGQKPHLMVRSRNNLGAETRVRYAPSTRFYLADKLAGKPWMTRLPHVVHVVEQVEVYDDISRNRFITRYAYHHGYFDGYEREFRGFGMVEQFDTEAFATLSTSTDLPTGDNVDASSHVPPVLTRTWFHTGAFAEGGRISRQFEHEYYREGHPSRHEGELTDAQLEAMLLPDTVLPADLSAEEAREAGRSLKGSILRQEIYARDGREESDRPYSVSERNYTIQRLQSQARNRHAVFFTHARETIDFHYERTLYDVTAGGQRQLRADPRVTHNVTLEVDDFGNVLKAVAIGYGRRFGDPNPDLDQMLNATNRQKLREAQQNTHLTLTENRYTNPVLDTDAYRAPLPCDARTYELINVEPAAQQANITNLFRFADLASNVEQASDGAHDLLYEDVTHVGAVTSKQYRRLIEHVRTLYRKNDLSGCLPLGQLDSMAMPCESYKLAFTPGLLAAVFKRPATNNAGEDLLPNPAPVLRDEGGYIRSQDQRALNLFPADTANPYHAPSDADDHWWIPSGHVFYHTDPTAAPALELDEARQRFFLPRRFRDPFGNSTRVSYDPYDLLVTRTVDALGNTVRAENDYRVLQPHLMIDPNGNRSFAAFDVLGMVVATAVRGKATQTSGDSLEDFTDADANPTLAALQSFVADPHAQAPALLKSASTRIVYDLDSFQREGQPAYAATLARETHVDDLPLGTPSKIQVSFSYSDGFGREIQKKIQAEPGPLNLDNPAAPIVDPRWVGSGWTIFNNKGKPVRQYEPFFSATHGFEFARVVGVSPVLFYDPVERVIATLHPNHTYEKVVFDPWRQTSWDVNDTVTSDPRTDSDSAEYVAGYFAQVAPQPADWQTWHAQRSGGTFGATPEQRQAEQAAAQKAAAHTSTPTTAFVDTLGRAFLTVADNGAAGTYATRTELDIEGNQRAVIDAKDRAVMRYDYDLLGHRIHQASMDAGERWMLNDVAGKPIRAWDSRDHQVRHAYDVLHRPTGLFVRTGNGAEKLAERTTYGEAQPNAAALNLRGKPFQQFDGAGVVTHTHYDFKGNLLNGSRQLLQNYKDDVDWAQSPALESETFTSSTAYDALNRPVTLTTPDRSLIRPAYNEANLLEQVSVNLHGATAATPFVTNIDYDAKGQRVLIAYGNGAITTYKHDPLTFRLTNLLTIHAADKLQDLHYTYDPVGNITAIRDDAQQTIYFDNRVVTPSAEYVYDAIYRLVEASGREHLGQTANNQLNSPRQTDHDDSFRMNLPQRSDGNAMGNYTERYEYDHVGNILRMIHAAGGGWTRGYSYSTINNRLLGTSLPGDLAGTFSARYQYDAHGNMTRMPHLPVMEWDFKDQLHATQQQVVNNGGIGEKTYYVYDAAGQRVRKVTERQNGTRKQERLYLGGFEVFREFNGDGQIVKLERKTLHVMDDKKRIALVETKTIDGTTAIVSPAPLIRYQLDNHLGSACLELDAVGGIISYEEYYPYGSTSYQAVRSGVEVSPKRYRYTGKERDEESGLYYHGARYYAAWLGRWTSCDPLGIAGGINIYLYGRSSPANFYDPNGLEDEKPFKDYPAARASANKGAAKFRVENPGMQTEVQAGHKFQARDAHVSGIDAETLNSDFWKLHSRRGGGLDVRIENPDGKIVTRTRHTAMDLELNPAVRDTAVRKVGKFSPQVHKHVVKELDWRIENTPWDQDKIDLARSSKRIEYNDVLPDGRAKPMTADELAASKVRVEQKAAEFAKSLSKTPASGEVTTTSASPTRKAARLAGGVVGVILFGAAVKQTVEQVKAGDYKGAAITAGATGLAFTPLMPVVAATGVIAKYRTDATIEQRSFAVGRRVERATGGWTRYATELGAAASAGTAVGISIYKTGADMVHSGTDFVRWGWSKIF